MAGKNAEVLAEVGKVEIEMNQRIQKLESERQTKSELYDRIAKMEGELRGMDIVKLLCTEAILKNDCVYGPLLADCWSYLWMRSHASMTSMPPLWHIHMGQPSLSGIANWAVLLGKPKHEYMVTDVSKSKNPSR